MLRAALVTVLSTTAAASNPCSASSAACCDPTATPAQLCPGGLACEPCGGGACECPTGPSPAPSPSPSLSPGPASSKRLTIVNGCSSKPIWIAHIAAGKVGPDPQDVKIAAGDKRDFITAVDGGGLPATRYWPKMGCDKSGSNCDVGGSGGPAEACVIRIPGKPDNYTQCAPPFDSKFEATFAPADAPTRDTVDVSLVDGWTLPFKLETSGGSCTRQGEAFSKLDCSELSLKQCPQSEMINGKAVSLHAIDPKSSKFVGCFSPCMKLVDDKWNTPGGSAAEPYCCSGSYGTPETCQAGPVLGTDYLKAVRQSCPAGYGYAYDDKRATIVCETTTHYTVTFYCPTSDAEDLLV